MFTESELPYEPITTARPPLGWLFASALSALAGGVLAWVGGSSIWWIIAWILAGPGALGLLAIFFNRDVSARAAGTYAEPSWLRALTWTCTGLALAAVLASALRIADWMGQL